VRPLSLPLALALVVGCGDQAASRLAVALSVDRTCPASSPAQLEMSCDANVGVWLLDGGSGAVLAQACVAYSDGPATLEALPAALSDSVEFAGITAELIQLELAVFSPARAGCPRLGTTAATPVVWGQSAVVHAPTAERIELSLSCFGAGDDGGDDDQCLASCAEDRQVCFAQYGARIEACLDASRECYERCEPSQQCHEWCADAEQECLAEADCNTRYVECASDCSGGPAC
jgi:hypothetical protein